MTAGPRRTLRRAHFAFMRAVLEGLDPKASWQRYLHTEDEAVDMRTVRAAVAWIRDEFAAAALRERRPGTARLVLIDPERFEKPFTAPTLEDFALARGLEDFSAADQADAYAEAFPEVLQPGGASAGRRGPPRARLIARQLDALRWLEGLVAKEPEASDSVAAWLNPAVAARLQQSGIPTLRALIDLINREGEEWCRLVPAVGTRKAARLVAWLRENPQLPALQLATALVMEKDNPAARHDRPGSTPTSTLVPLEKMIAPSALDGREGQYRARRTECLLTADTDLDAVKAWLEPACTAPVLQRPAATRRAYRKEAERLMLWCLQIRGKAMTSLDLDDAVDYLRFLGAPPAEWCGNRHHPRTSPHWRPMEGAVSEKQIKQVLTVIRTLYGFWVRQGYMVTNPFALVQSVPATHARRPGPERAFNPAQWGCIEAALAGRLAARPSTRLERAVTWLYATGLRLGELATARCGDLSRADLPSLPGNLGAGWSLRVAGRAGSGSRQIPVPAELVEELECRLAEQGQPAEATARANANVAILASFGQGRLLPWSSSGLSKALKQWLAKLAAQLPAPDAQAFRLASAHWFRRTYGLHALEGRGGRPAAPIDELRVQLGHAAPRTTRAYLGGVQMREVDGAPCHRAGGSAT